MIFMPSPNYDCYFADPMIKYDFRFHHYHPRCAVGLPRRGGTMTDAREDNEIAAPAEATAAEPVDDALPPAGNTPEGTEPPTGSGEADPQDDTGSYIVNMDRASAFRPDALPAAEVPAELAPLLERAFLFLEDGDWARADEYCEKVLDQAPRTPMAYLGKFMADKHVKTREELPDVPIDPEGDPNYSKAVRFAPPALADVLTRYALTGRSAKKQKRIRRAVTAAVAVLVCLAVSAGAAAAVWYGKLLPEKTFAAELAALENAVIGDTVTFGSFRNPAEWTVLEKNGDELLLLSRRAVGISRYNDSSTDTTWEKSDIRRWLNGEYRETAFGSRERTLIADTEAMDGLFLPDLAEVNRHLKTEVDKRCLAPLPEKTKTAGTDAAAEYTGWWLRTQTGEGLPACYVDENGAVQYDYYGEDPALGVRPAMRVNLGNRQ